MRDAPDTYKLARQITVLEERMETRKAEFATEFATFRESFATEFAEMREDNAKFYAEAAKRETRMLLAFAAMLAVGLTVHSFLN